MRCLLPALVLIPVVATAQPRAAILEDVDLGRQLFNDPILSSDGSRSCATCHLEAKGFSSGGLPAGMDGRPLTLKAPSLYGVKRNKLFMWDGRAKSLEAQVLLPLLNQNEMRNVDVGPVLERVNQKYKLKLIEADLTGAIAAYERTIAAPLTAFDRFLAGDPAPLTESERRGYEVFRGAGKCYQCHTGPDLTDGKLHRTMSGTFKTPGIRGCVRTGPYMHDAGLKTLRDLIDHYDAGTFETPPLRLSPRQKTDLVAFLRVL